jgi:hypothetical protein
MEGLFQPGDDLPLVSPPQPVENALARGTMWVLAGLASVWTLAALEHAALDSESDAVMFLGLLLGSWLAQVAIASRRPAASRIAWTYRDDGGGQRLGLTE